MTTDTTLETLCALEARLRQLFTDLGVPADEAVELRADELAAVLDVRTTCLTGEAKRTDGRQEDA